MAGKVELRILLPSKVKILTNYILQKNQLSKLNFFQDAGAIIGRGGSNIKKLRQEVSVYKNLLFLFILNIYLYMFSD